MLTVLFRISTRVAESTFYNNYHHYANGVTNLIGQVKIMYRKKARLLTICIEPGMYSSWINKTFIIIMDSSDSISPLIPINHCTWRVL